MNILVTDAPLQPRILPASQLLRDRQQSLLKLLPAWQDAQES